MKRIVRKIARLFGLQAVASPLSHQYNYVQQGNNCSIDPSAILTCTEQSKIALEGENYIGRNVEIGPIQLISIGQHSSIQDRCILLGDIEIGRYCLFAPNVFVSSGRHYFDLKPEYYIKDQDELVRNSSELKAKHSQKITIEDDCWIGVNAVIQPDVTIGKGCVIGANAVVTKNVEPYSVMAGIPAKLIRKRLEFTAKSDLNFDTDSDLPYFYSGFYSSFMERKESSSRGGIRTKCKFKIYLQANVSKSISLTGKYYGVIPVKLSYLNQELEINSENFSICFTCGSNEMHCFNLLTAEEKNNFSGPSDLYLQKVNIE
jgi:acetyltransferase-like isoleucine patch superfamily enzyme